MASIKDVARLAGVSTATVSCTLSGKKHVSRHARIKILAAIEKLNYIPNENARKLKDKTSRDIGVLLTSIDDTYHGEIFKGISTVIQENNFSINIAFSNNQPKVETGILNNFISRNYAGIILISCMSDDTRYFEKLLARKIPVVFIERRPAKLNVNFVGISNKKTVSFLAEALLRRGYRDIALFCGNPAVSSEEDCVMAFKEFNRSLRRPAEYGIHYTNMSREDAFRTALTALNKRPGPDAIIATSENIGRGIMESARVLGNVINRILIVSFGEETWMNSIHEPNSIRSSRPAFALGAEAAKLLLANIAPDKTDKGAGSTGSVILDDNILYSRIDIPLRRSSRKEKEPGHQEELSILMLDNDLAGTMKILAKKFMAEYGVSIAIERRPQKDLSGEIIADTLSSRPRHDIFMFDIPWLTFLVQNGFLEDISAFITQDPSFFNSIIKENLVNSMYRNHYYSIPFVGGAQLLFYRNDLFEDPLICQDYFSMTGARLQPPRTWTEFNAVARFFTRRLNPASPVEYGTSCPGSTAEDLCPEIYNRIWGYNGSLFSGKNLPQCNTANNIKAFENLIELRHYISRPILETGITDTVSDFYEGKTAMLTNFTVYAAKITDAINHKVFGRLGFTFVPHRSPISIGWNLGLNPFSEKKKTALTFFKWLYRKDVNYYLTILDGQSTSVYPYQNNELLKLYPWMRITMDNFKYTRKRTMGHKKNAIIIPLNRIEEIIYAHTRRMFGRAPIPECLDSMDREITRLIKVYGHLDN
ncbi:MAG: extracellular solute-binding protein [Treponema sp.]|jgi:multiple sugar transport system substrate-binding protein|nr:extracellular solute-binding protein [Treponema sp.]